MATPARMQQNRPIETDIPLRLDRLRWSRWHSRIIIALGTSWLLEFLEVTLVGSLSGILERNSGLRLTDPQVTGAANRPPERDLLSYRVVPPIWGHSCRQIQSWSFMAARGPCPMTWLRPTSAGSITLSPRDGGCSSAAAPPSMPSKKPSSSWKTTRLSMPGAVASSTAMAACNSMR